MKIKIVKDKRSGFYWSICISKCNIADGYAETYQEAEKDAIAELKKIAKGIEEKMKMYKMKTYEKKPFKAFRWFGEEYNGIVCSNSRSFYKGTSISNGDWIFPETGHVIVDGFFQKFFEEVTA